VICGTKFGAEFEEEKKRGRKISWQFPFNVVIIKKNFIQQLHTNQTKSFRIELLSSMGIL
jgi:hypothetical protein